LAEQVFAPHYAAHVTRRLKTPTPLRSGRDVTAETIAELAAGDIFELLDVTGGIAWGIAPAAGLVGYVSAEALEPVI
jgi:hypothetical protein